MSQLLLLEDDGSLGATLAERLVKEGYAVRWVRSLGEARAALARQSFDLAILDLGLPDGSGFEFAREAKAAGDLPVLFLTAMATAENRLAGYELGAEEFIPKPFHLKELLMRVAHVLQNHAPRRELKLGDRRIDFARMAVSDASGKNVYLAAKDCEVLRLLVAAAPAVVSRDEILEKVWGEANFPSNRTVDNAIVRLRQALGDTGASLIRTVRGVGYQFVSAEEEKRHVQ